MPDILMRMRSLLFLCTMFPFLGSACKSPAVQMDELPAAALTADGASADVTLSSLTTPVPTQTSSSEPLFQPSKTFSSTPPQSQSPSPTITQQKTPTQTSTPSTSPTYAILRGTVLEQSNCRYGPGAAYLYKYGLYSGNNLQVIGKNETGSWILVQAIGGNNPCWLKASLMDLHGDVFSLAPGSLPLPESPYYGPVTGVSSDRNGDTVSISWNPINLRAGDDSLQFPYLIEAWICQDGKLIFQPVGSWETSVIVIDQPGCPEPSHARIYGVEKHGYTAWVTIPWTQP